MRRRAAKTARALRPGSRTTGQTCEARGLDSSPLNGAKYDTGVIKIDRNQHGAFKGTLEQFLARRAPASYVNKAKGLMKSQAGLLNKIQKRYGVQPEVILAIWGMETGFGANSGNKSVFQPLATLAYDCRRSAFFTNELDAALEIAHKGYIPASQMKGAGFGELGQTQFLPSKYLQFAVDFDGDGRRDLIHSRADVLASTANFLRGHGWSAGGGYGPGESNYGVGIRGTAPRSTSRRWPNSPGASPTDRTDLLPKGPGGYSAGLSLPGQASPFALM